MPETSFQMTLADPGQYKPRRLRFSKATVEVESWGDVLAKVGLELLRTPRYRRPLIAARQTDTWLARRRRGMKHPVELEHHVWLDTGGVPRALWARTRALLDLCLYPPAKVLVEYFNDCSRSVPTSTAKPVEPGEKKNESIGVRRAAQVLFEAFRDGIRPGSIIDRNKFARVWKERFGEELPAEFDLKAILPEIGMTIGDKVFPVGAAGAASPATFVRALAERGHALFFYDTLFDAESSRFMGIGIQSGEMLRTALRKEAPDSFSYGRSAFATPGSPRAVADAVDAVFQERDEWSKEDLGRRFPYVPPDKIASALAQDDRFVRVASGTYRLLSSILLDEPECAAAATEVSREVSSKGFSSLARLRLVRSMERNGEIAETSVRLRFFQRFLSDEFDRHGQVVCPRGADLDSRIAIRAFCRENDEVAVSDLLQMEEEFALGGGNRSIETAHEEMVRVSEDRFVSPRLVPFDPPGVDAALESAVPPSGVMPLVSMRSFVSFPPVAGWPWNAYLLESYLRRESAAFAFLSVSAAPRTACGAIVRRSAGFASVVDALARAVAEAGVLPTAEVVGDYLVGQGYIQRRRGVEKEVAESARRLKTNETTLQGALQ